MEAEGTVFDMYSDLGAKVKTDLETAGFVNIKIWEQPSNILFKSREDYMEQIGNSKCD